MPPSGLKLSNDTFSPLEVPGSSPSGTKKRARLCKKTKNTSYYNATLTIGTESNRGTDRESNQGQSDNHMSDHQLYYTIYDDLWHKEQQIIYNDNT